jgi:hypothetical protein
MGGQAVKALPTHLCISSLSTKHSSTRKTLIRFQECNVELTLLLASAP